MTELDALGKSNSQLVSCGSLLNQIAAKLNSGKSVEMSVIARAVDTYQETVKPHLVIVNQMMLSNSKRWAIVEVSNDDD
ncbi:hypothetical protein [Pseudoxanthomonas mexicana]